MKIRSKLYGLVGGSLLVLVLAGGVYLALLSPQERIEEERRTLDELSTALLSLQVEVNRLDTLRFSMGREHLASRLKELDAAFQAVRGSPSSGNRTKR
ncbi:hypothetical protein [Spirochaeta thermophila]|nr:hypothetical protein [Spirochaeta thermophila]